MKKPIIWTIILLLLLLVAFVPAVMADQDNSNSRFMNNTVSVLKELPELDMTGMHADIELIEIDPEITHATEDWMVLAHDDAGKKLLIEDIDSSNLTAAGKIDAKNAVTKLWDTYPTKFEDAGKKSIDIVVQSHGSNLTVSVPIGHVTRITFDREKIRQTSKDNKNTRLMNAVQIGQPSGIVLTDTENMTVKNITNLRAKKSQVISENSRNPSSGGSFPASGSPENSLSSDFLSSSSFTSESGFPSSPDKTGGKSGTGLKAWSADYYSTYDPPYNTPPQDPIKYTGHNSFAYWGAYRMGLDKSYRDIAAFAGIEPDTWTPIVDPSGGKITAVMHSIGHYYNPNILDPFRLIVIGQAPGEFDTYAAQAHAAGAICLSSQCTPAQFDDLATKFGYADHYLTDVGNPMHTGREIDQYYDAEIAGTDTHAKYESDYVNAFSNKTNTAGYGKFGDLVANNNVYYPMTNPVQSIVNLATFSHTYVDTLYYRVRNNPNGFQSDPTVNMITQNCILASARYTNGFAYYVMDTGTYGPPSADFTYSLGAHDANSATVTFTSTSHGATSYLWTFPDGLPSSTASDVTKTFTFAGMKTVTLTATNQYGSDSKSMDIPVGREPPVVSFNTVQQQYPYIKFVSTSVGIDPESNPTLWYWDFGDSTNSTDSTSPEITHAYLIPDAYLVTLTAKNIYGNSAGSQVVIVSPQALAAFVFTRTGKTMHFVDKSTSASAWYWDFGDGATSTDQNPTHTYSQTGTYNVQLQIQDAHYTDQPVITQQVTVADVADFSATPTTGNAPLTVQFTDSSTPTPISWSWDFGDGHTSSEQNPQDIYSENGTYTVTLTAVQDGELHTKIRENYITVGPLTPVASFGSNVTSGRSPLAVAFSDLSSRSPTNWSWNFGDENTSNLKNPVNTYSKEGSYNVSLIASNVNGSSLPTTIINYITVSNVPLQNGSYWTIATSNAQWPEKSNFAATVYNNKIWVMGGLSAKNDTWSSADGITWTQATATAQWPGRNRLSAVTFNNKMWVLGGNTNGPAMNDTWYSTNGISWTKATATAQWMPRYDQTALVHNNRIWVMAGQDNSAAKNDVWSSADGVTWNLATWNAPWTARLGSAAVSFNGKIWLLGGRDWTGTYFNDVWYSTGGTAWTRATANAAWSGRYQPQAVVYDNKIWIIGGQDNSGDKNDIWYSTDGITWTQATGNANWAARFSSQALVFNNTMWVLGGTGYNDVWHAGVYTPVANFTANSTYGSAPLAITFTDTANNAPTSWLWNFGDNQTSTQKNPIHSYVSAGTYTVSLKAINEAGNNTMVRSNYITVTPAPLPNGSYWTLATSSAAWPGKSDFAATVYNNKMWVMGGYSTKNDVWSSTNGISWTQATATAQWAGRNRLSALTFNNKMWVLGGNTNGPAMNDVWSSSNGASWTRVTAAAQWPARYDQTALIHNNKMWVLAGQDNSGAKNDVWSSADGVTWSRATSAASWTARRGSAAVSFNGKIWLLGGRSWTGTYFNDVWNSTDGTTWTRATANATWSGRYQPQAVVYDNKIWIIGGQDISSQKNDVWYSSDGVTWAQATGHANWSARSPQALVFNNTVWVIGGSGYHDVWYASTPQ